MKSFIAFALLFAAVVASASAAPAGDSSADLEAPKVLDKRLKKLAKSVAAAKDGKDKQKCLVERIYLTVVPFSIVEAESSGSDDVVAVINDIVSVLNNINGMNSVGLDSVDVVNTGTGFGEIEVVAGNTGETVKVQVGDLTNVIGSIQGTWVNNDVVDNDIGIDSNNEN